ncbi:MAG TPA: hypothetical protein VD794_09535, partial [Flavisolibacter sp.]|nr:hypothetical protein [Flavisolibacter sp.]
MDNKIIYSNEINHKIVQAFTSNSDTSKLNKYEISKKAQKHFNMLYKNGNPAWQKLGKNFLASLEQDG